MSKRQLITAGFLGATVGGAIFIQAGTDSNGDGFLEFLDGEVITADDMNTNFDRTAAHVSTFESAFTVNSELNIGLGGAPVNDESFYIFQDETGSGSHLNLRLDKSEGGEMLQLTDGADFDFLLGIDSTNNYGFLGSTSQTETLVVKGGNVGIGTNSPANYGSNYRSLEIKGGTTSTGGVFQTSSSDSSVVARLFVDSGLGMTGTSTNHGFVIQTNGTERLRVDPTGNLGIGTTSPVSRFQVKNTTPYDGEEDTYAVDSIALFGATGNQNGAYFGGITWHNDGRRRAGIASVMENADADYVGIAFFTQGTDGPGPMYESMRIARSGKVGIGTTLPSTTLHIKTTGTALRLERAGYDTFDFQQSTGTGMSIYNVTDSRSEIVFNGNGNTGFGTTSPDTTSRIHSVTGNLADFAGYFQNTDSGGDVYVKLAGASAYNIAAQFMNGNVGIGTTSPSYLLHVNGGVGANSYTTISDARLKRDVEPIEGALTGVQCLAGVTYFWKDEKLPQDRQMGLLAQDVEACFPEVVTTNADGIKGVLYAQLVAPLIEAIKELSQWAEQTSDELEGERQLNAKQQERIEEQVKVNREQQRTIEAQEKMIQSLITTAKVQQQRIGTLESEVQTTQARLSKLESHLQAR